MHIHQHTRLPILFVLVLSLLLPALAHARPQADSAILFIGDGMGPNQVELVALADKMPLAMQRMPYSGTAVTLSAGDAVTDSAAAGTALATGHKTKNGRLGLLPDGQRVENIAELGRRRGKSIGIITTDALWGATPAAFAVHVKSRGEYAEIAQQMADSGALVMMGFGSSQFLPASAGGKRTDKRDLLAGLRKSGYDVVTTKDELAKDKNLRLVGLFEDGPTAPSLAEMTRAALLRLAQNPKGFFLMVEGARIDWAGHRSDPAGVFQETAAFDAAVQEGLDLARRRGETLVVVTADHETGGLTIEEPRRAVLFRRVHGDSSAIADHLNADRSNVATVMAEYAGIRDLTPAETDQIKSAKEPAAAVAVILSRRAGVGWTSEGRHTGTPVRVFASGPGAERFTGALDNTQIPSEIADTLGLGPFPKP